jgi:hypothetical protein
MVAFGPEQHLSMRGMLINYVSSILMDISLNVLPELDYW